MPVSPDGAPSTFTFDRVVRFLLGAAAVGSVGWMVWYFAGIVLYLIVGGVLAYLLRPPSTTSRDLASDGSRPSWSPLRSFWG
jgi:hypothetical protein